MRRFVKIFLLIALLLPLLASCGDKNKTKYLAVKLAKTEKWSIIDVSNGNVVVKEAFIYKPSPIVNDRFFVENEYGDIEFHEVKNYGKPIKTYKLATNFYDNRAIVSEDGKVLKVIDEEGNVVKTLPKDIRGAMTFRNGYAVVMNDKGKMGYIDVDGEFLVKPTYDKAQPFSKDHYAIAMKKKDNSADNYKVSVINDKGEEQFDFNIGEKEPYASVASSYFVNGSMAVVKGDDVVYIDKNGEQMFKAGDNLIGKFGIYKGATIYAKDQQWGIMDDNGEVLLNAKYDKMIPIENGKFMATKDDRVMIIDKEGEKVSNDTYHELVRITEDRLLIKYKSGQGYSLADSDGKEVCDESFIDYSDPYEIKTINLDKYASHNSDDDSEGEAEADGGYSGEDNITYDRPYTNNGEKPYGDDDDDENVYQEEEQAVQPKDDYDYDEINEL